MSRFADPKAVARFTLPGGCQCPGGPHSSDWFDIRTDLSAKDRSRIQESAGDDLGVFEVILAEWNLLDDDGSPAPLDREHIDLLRLDDLDGFGEWLVENVKGRPLPNESGAPSGNGSRESASPTPRTRKRR